MFCQGGGGNLPSFKAVASRKHNHVAIFTATDAVNIATWLFLRRYTSYLWCHLSNVI